MKDSHLFNTVIEAWRLQDPLTLNQAAALWARETPPEHWVDQEDLPVPPGDKSPTNSFSEIKLFERILSNICSAINRHPKLKDKEQLTKNSTQEVSRENTLEPYYFYPSRVFSDEGYDTGENDPKMPHPNKTTVSRRELARWAIATEQFPPFLKKDIDKLLPYRKKVINTPPYLDPEHKFHSDELKIAVEVWLHFFNEDNFTPNKAPKTQLEGYIRKNYPSIKSSRAIGRIATLINPLKDGGPPKSTP